MSLKGSSPTLTSYYGIHQTSHDFSITSKIFQPRLPSYSVHSIFNPNIRQRSHQTVIPPSNPSAFSGKSVSSP